MGFGGRGWEITAEIRNRVFLVIVASLDLKYLSRSLVLGTKSCQSEWGCLLFFRGKEVGFGGRG